MRACSTGKREESEKHSANNGKSRFSTDGVEQNKERGRKNAAHNKKVKICHRVGDGNSLFLPFQLTMIPKRTMMFDLSSCAGSLHVAVHNWASHIRQFLPNLEKVESFVYKKGGFIMNTIEVAGTVCVKSERT